MAVAQGIRKQTNYKVQSALGTPATGSGGQTLRRNSSVFSYDRDTFETDEIVTHQQSTGVGYGVIKANGKIDGLLSCTTWDTLLQALLRADFVATAAIASLTLTIAASGSDYTITRSAGDFLTGGIKAGDVIRLTGGSLNANNVGKNALVLSLTATVLTVRVLGAGLTMTAESAIVGCTVTVTGKKAKPPLTGHTNYYWTIEEWFADLLRSEKFTDCQIAKADIALPSTGNATISLDVLGLGMVAGGSQILTTPTAETTTSVLTAVNGLVVVNGTVVANCTGATLMIDGRMKHGDAVIGSNNLIDIDKGKIAVSGSFSALFDSDTISALYRAETPISLMLVVTDDETADADFVTFTLGRIKLTGNAPDDGEKGIVRNYPFVAELNSAGGTSLAWDQTIITVQDSLAA